MNEVIATNNSQQYKRNVSYKFRIGSIISGQPILENERLKSVKIDSKEVVRVNVIANVTDKFVQEGEKKFASLTLDDATGQIKVKTFGEDIEKVAEFQQGDTLLVIGLVRHWNNEIYLTPEIIKKKDPAFLLIRKLEIEQSQPKTLAKEEIKVLRDKILELIKTSEPHGGISIEQIILNLKESPETINNEIKKLLEDGAIYEPRPGKVRYLG